MSSKNDHTGDSIITKNISEVYRNNYDAIFRKSKEDVVQLEHQQTENDYEIPKTASDTSAFFRIS